MLGAAPVVAWAFSQDGLTTDRAPIAARVDAGHEFGALLVLMASVLLAAGSRCSSPPRSARRRRARAGSRAARRSRCWRSCRWSGLIGLATAQGGVDGQVSKAWDQLTDPNARTPANTPDRLTATSSVRARYWAEALDIHATDPWLGTGAGAYATVRTRFRTDALAVRHAHGYVVQTLADLGWVGLALSLLAAGAWLLAAARATGVRRRDRGLPYDAERIGMLTLSPSSRCSPCTRPIDWTWFVPANAGVALLCAGWVVGRGPLRAGSSSPRARRHLPPPPWPHASRLARLGRRVPPLRGLAVAPRARASRSPRHGRPTSPCAPSTRATPRSTGSTRASRRPRPTIARIATERNPLSVDPLFELAAIEQARGRTQEARRRSSVRSTLQPANPEAWRRLGRLRLSVLNDPQGALDRLPGGVLPRPAARRPRPRT